MRIKTALAGLLVAACVLAQSAQAETIHIAKQYGVSYLPLIVMQEEKLLEAEGKARGLDLSAEYMTISNGATINDALISGNLEFASGGVGPMLTLWGKTRTSLKVRGVATLNAMPIWLVTSNPDIHVLHDFTEKDRIALPAVKVTIQSVVLQMDAAREFGLANYAKYDALTVSLGHPDRVLNSYDVLGGPHTFNAVWATSAYHDAHPKEVAAFLAALDRAQKLIKADPKHAAELYIRNEKSKIPLDRVAEIIAKPENEWTMQPKRVMQVAHFMHSIGSLSTDPADWKELFFPDIYAQGGN